MKFLNSFLNVAFLLVAICAVLSFAKPKGSTDKVPIELKFFHYGHHLDRCACDDYQSNQDYYDCHNPHDNEFQFKLRLLFEKVLEDSQESDDDNASPPETSRLSDDDNGHTIRYVLGMRDDGDVLLLSVGEIDPNHEDLAKKQPWGPGVALLEEISITAIELNINQTSTLGKAYLMPGGNRFLLGVELVNGRPLGYDMKVYGFHVSNAQGFF